MLESCRKDLKFALLQARPGEVIGHLGILHVEKEGAILHNFLVGLQDPVIELDLSLQVIADFLLMSIFEILRSVSSPSHTELHTSVTPCLPSLPPQTCQFA